MPDNARVLNYTVEEADTLLTLSVPVTPARLGTSNTIACQ